MATILLTGAGGAALPDLIRHLQGIGHRVLTCDMDPHAAGLYLGDGGFVVPRATDSGFGEALNQLCARERVDVLVPLVDEELIPLRINFRWPAVKLAPKVEFIQTCLDKMTLMATLHWHGLSIPKTMGVDVWGLPYPLVIKPRHGRGSRGVLIVKDLQEADGLRWDGNTHVAQEYIDGPEYTVSVVVDESNVCHAVVPKRIILKQGATRLAVTERNEKIDTLCRRIAEVLTPCGPFNVQLRLRNGEPYVFEINPRFSGTVNLTIAAGCDEVGGLIELALGRPYTFGEWREGVVLVRQTHDAVMDEAHFQAKTPRRWDG